MTSDLFDPPGITWTPVSPALTRVSRIVTVPPLLVGAMAAVAVAGTGIGPTWLTALLAGIGLALVVIAGWAWVWSPRHTASWGYAEADDDLLVRGGLLFRRLVAVPYGRMQFVDVQAGPLERAFGIASVTLHTASTETAATIPGLPADEATRLRNRLTELGEAHGAGL